MSDDRFYNVGGGIRDNSLIGIKRLTQDEVADTLNNLHRVNILLKKEYDILLDLVLDSGLDYFIPDELNEQEICENCKHADEIPMIPIGWRKNTDS